MFRYGAVWTTRLTLLLVHPDSVALNVVVADTSPLIVNAADVS